MDDNATCHRTLAVQNCLDSEGIQRLVWPARSPDLNPIENVWDALGRQVAGRNYPPTNKNTLIRALTEEWDKLPQQLLDSVVQTTRGLLVTDLIILKHGQVTRTTHELEPPLRTTTLHQWEDVSALDRWNVHRSPTGQFFSGTRLELMKCLPCSDTLATGLPQPLSWSSKALCFEPVIRRHGPRVCDDVTTWLPRPPSFSEINELISCVSIHDSSSSRVVKVTDSQQTCYEFQPSTAEDPCVEGTLHFKSVKAQMSPVSIVWKLGKGCPVRQLNLEVDSDDVQELLDSHNL
ncbi:transposable element Tcb2 transposase [Trichonephila clavipes]|nr:transposable element Tcb2 transposase [Trichonephila clavipes]